MEKANGSIAIIQLLNKKNIVNIKFYETSGKKMAKPTTYLSEMRKTRYNPYLKESKSQPLEIGQSKKVDGK